MAVTVTLGGLELSGNIECVDWWDLLKTGDKRGENRPVPGVAGRGVRPRVTDELRASIQVRITGDTHDAMYVHLKSLRDVCDVNTTQTLVFDWGAGSDSVDCIVEEMDTPRWTSPTFLTVLVDLTLPDGPLDLTPDP